MSRATMVDEQRPEEENALNKNEEFVDLLSESAELAPEIPERTSEASADKPVEKPAVPKKKVKPLPEKYRGKGIRDLVEMHQEAEKLLGRQSSEVGDLRKVVDDFIQSQTQQAAPQQYVEPEDDIDYFTNPQAAVNRAIENHPKVKEAEQYSASYRKQAALAELNNKHPDMQKILADEKFQEWINASKIRSQLFVAADKQYDAEAADELFTLWKERKNVARQTATVEKQARKQQVRAANTGNVRGNSEGSRKKIYRRADIIKLMKTDPERYQSLSEEIFKAYAEGRVK